MKPLISSIQGLIEEVEHLADFFKERYSLRNLLCMLHNVMFMVYFFRAFLVKNVLSKVGV